MIRRHCDSRFVSDSYGDLSFATAGAWSRFTFGRRWECLGRFAFCN
jgi:hypothetical protein